MNFLLLFQASASSRLAFKIDLKHVFSDFWEEYARREELLLGLLQNLKDTIIIHTRETFQQIVLNILTVL